MPNNIRVEKLGKIARFTPLFATDTIYEILSFLSYGTVIEVCSLISKQWYHACTKMPIKIVIHRHVFDYERIKSHWNVTSLDGYGTSHPSNQSNQESSLSVLSRNHLLTNMKYLSISTAQSTASEVFTLCSTASNLTCLKLPLNNLGQECIDTMVQSPHLSRLTHLDLVSNAITDINPLLISLKHLRELFVGCNNIRKIEPVESGLTLLDINNNHLSQFHLNMKELTELDISVNPIDGKCLSNLFIGGTTPKLTKLRANSIGTITELSLRECYLSELSLTCNGIKDEVCRSLASASCLSGLTGLDLSGNPISRTGLAYITESDCLGSVRSLMLSGLHIDDYILYSILNSKLFEKMVDHGKYLLSVSRRMLSQSLIQAVQDTEYGDGIRFLDD